MNTADHAYQSSIPDKNTPHTEEGHPTLLDFEESLELLILDEIRTAGPYTQNLYSTINYVIRDTIEDYLTPLGNNNSTDIGRQGLTGRFCQEVRSLIATHMRNTNPSYMGRPEGTHEVCSPQKKEKR